MLIAKVNPTGIDESISKIQSRIYSLLTTKYGWTNYECYPRVYLNPREDGLIPEYYQGKNEYKDVLYNDKFNVTSFFIVGGTRSYVGGKFTQKISLIFQADITKLYTSIPHRADEEMHRDIYLSVNKTVWNQYITSIITGLDQVFNDVNIPSKMKEKLKIKDMSNYHIVKIDLEVPFEYCCC